MDLVSLIDTKASTRAERISQTIQRFMDAYNSEFTSLIIELKYHENFLEQIERRILEGVIVVEDARRFFQLFSEGKEEAFQECLEANTSSWIPHIESIRQTVAQLMMSRQFKSRPCWIQLRDKATFIIMVLEELTRILLEDESVTAPDSPENAPLEHRKLTALLAEETFTPKESHDYDMQHLAIHAYLARDQGSLPPKSDNPFIRFFRMIREWFGEKSDTLRSRPGFVKMTAFFHLSELFPPIREVFESGLEKYAQKGLPPIYYHFKDDADRVVVRRILFQPLLRNLDSLRKVSARIKQDVKRKDALLICFEPTCLCLREIKIASEFLFHGEPGGGESPELQAIQNLIPLTIGDLRELSRQIAKAEEFVFDQ